MIRVVHLIKFLGHPDQPYMVDLFKALDKKNDEVSHTIFCSKNLDNSLDIKYNEAGSKSNFFNIKTILFLFKNLFSKKLKSKTFHELSLKEKIKFLIKWERLLNTNVDVAHVHNLHMLPLEVLRFLKARKVKLIASLRGRDLVIGTLKELENKEFLKTLSFFDKVHVNSDYLFKLAIAKGVNDKKLIRIYRGVDTYLYKKENFNELDYESSKEALKLIVVGRLVWEKAHFYILDSIYRLSKKGIRVECDIYGEGRFREFLEFRIQQLKIEDSVNLKGYIDNSELRTIYKNYSIAIHPSFYDSLPNGLVEMCLHNLPCVVSNAGGMLEFITDGINGISFDINNPTALDEAILKATHLNKENLKKHNLNLYSKFSFSEAVKQLNQLYLNC